MLSQHFSVCYNEVMGRVHGQDLRNTGQSEDNSHLQS